MAQHYTTTINAPNARRRWDRVFEITLSDVVADVNLRRNGIPYLFIQNVGTGGLVNIVWDDDVEEDIYLAQGATLEGGQWKHAKTTGTVVGAALRGFRGTAYQTPGI